MCPWLDTLGVQRVASERPVAIVRMDERSAKLLCARAVAATSEYRAYRLFEFAEHRMPFVESAERRVRRLLNPQNTVYAVCLNPQFSSTHENGFAAFSM